MELQLPEIIGVFTHDFCHGLKAFNFVLSPYLGHQRFEAAQPFLFVNQADKPRYFIERYVSEKLLPVQPLNKTEVAPVEPGASITRHQRSSMVSCWA